ncbi:molybdopterin-synthase adenylyltransferase MoeB [Celeribacter arenosi]|uniref:HesA/MoeB/ThiF family protein n=1 Tax=Celeribacter arenosi TaxID=792649 RepID=A0ABP7K2I7_9RHOB
MILFLALAAALWGVGAYTGAPARARWAMIGVLYLAVLLAVAILPEGAQPFGGRLGEWLLLGAFAAIVTSYRLLLRRLRARATPATAQPDPAQPDPASNGPFTAGELDRYMRHIVLRDIGGPGQKKLKETSVLIIGAGGLGAPVIQYLAASGVGTLGVIDDDIVDLSNLQRQVIHTDARIGMPKVFSAAEAVAALNPHVTLRPYNRRFDETCGALIAEYDMVIDGCDNFDTRYLVNRLCAAQHKPLLAAAITQWEGQISTYNSGENAPCYQCVFPNSPSPDMVPTCAEAGVAAPLPGILGTMLAMEAVKEITGAGTGLSGRLLIYDALHTETRTIRTKKRADCPVCG